MGGAFRNRSDMAPVKGMELVLMRGRGLTTAFGDGAALFSWLLVVGSMNVVG